MFKNRYSIQRVARSMIGRLVVPLSMALVACSSTEGFSEAEGFSVEDHATGEISQPLNGNLIFGATPGLCNDTTNKAAFRAKFTNAFTQWLKPNFFTSKATMTQCLKEAILSGEEYHATHGKYEVSYPEEVMRRLSENISTTIDCREGTGCSCNWGGPNERFTCDLGCKDAADSYVAAVSIHEIAHRTYTHPSDLPEESWVSVNQSVARCIETFAQGSTPPTPLLPGPPNYTLRSALQREATLAQVGMEGGFAYAPSNCGSSSFVSGFFGSAASFVDSFGLTCRPLSIQNTVNLNSAGGTGGTPFTRTCGFGELAVGMRGGAGAWLDSVGLICMNEDTIGTGATTPVSNGSLAGGAGGVSWERRCPPFMALKGVRTRAASYVDRLEFLCQDVRDPVRVHNSITELAGTSSTYHYLEQCQSESVITDLTLKRTASFVHRVGGVCEGVVHDGSSTGHKVVRSGLGGHVLPSHGGSGGEQVKDSCGAGRALVGLRMYFDSDTVAGIRGICANVGDWTSQASMAVSFTPARGNAIGAAHDRQCPLGQMMVGAFTNTDDKVHGIKPTCRQFGN
jgi:hypothetical protein